VKISVVTAVRNGAATIGATLASVAEQTGADVEHVVVDGASTDDTVARIRAAGASVGRFLCEPDRGVYDAFNKGWRLSSGDVVGYLNSGDVYTTPRELARVAAAFERPDVDAVFGDVLIVDEHDLQRALRVYRSGGFRPSRLAYGFMPAHPTLFVRREFYERLDGYDPSFRIAGDYDFCLRLFLQERARYQYLGPGAMVRMPRGGLSNQGWRSTWTITREMHRACRARGVPTSMLKLTSRLPAKALEVLLRHA
jgi:glycosyltransferase involved in cell wall biosynthesis